jgi:hypothetical protein
MESRTTAPGDKVGAPDRCDDVTGVSALLLSSQCAVCTVAGCSAVATLQVKSVVCDPPARSTRNQRQPGGLLTRGAVVRPPAITPFASPPPRHPHFLPPPLRRPRPAPPCPAPPAGRLPQPGRRAGPHRLLRPALPRGVPAPGLGHGGHGAPGAQRVHQGHGCADGRPTGARGWFAKEGGPVMGAACGERGIYIGGWLRTGRHCIIDVRRCGPMTGRAQSWHPCQPVCCAARGHAPLGASHCANGRHPRLVACAP